MPHAMHTYVLLPSIDYITNMLIESSSSARRLDVVYACTDARTITLRKQ